MKKPNPTTLLSKIDNERRRFLRLGLIAISSLGFSACDPARKSMARDDLASWLTDLLANKDDAAFLGAEFLKTHPNEITAKRLTQFIAQAIQRSGTVPDTSIRFRAAATSVIREEYQYDDTVLVDGWVLSRTEARIYAWALVAG